MKKRNRKRKVLTVDLPSYWASYLINGDASGMSQLEFDHCNCRTKNLGYCSGCSDESYFGRFDGLGCDLLTYTFIQD